MPEISVLMCVYNGQKYLSESVKSILKQTLHDIEFVIVDDGSDDQSYAILKAFADQDDRIKLIRNSKNLGISLSVFEGLKHCTGKYIARMDQDDISLPNRLLFQVQYLKKYEEIDALGTGFEFIGEDGTITGLFPDRPSDSMIIRHQMMYHCVLHNPTVMMKAEFYKKYNENSDEEEYYGADDYHFWLRQNFEHLYSNLPDHLLHYRRHDSQVSIKDSSLQLVSILRSAHEAFEKLLNKHIPLEVIRTFYFVQRYETDDLKSAREAIRVIYQAQRVFEKRNELTRDQKLETRRYTYEKLKSVVVKYKKFPLVLLSGIYFLLKVFPGKFFYDLFPRLELRNKG